ncbi:putative pentatricopeptide repeat-containing protein At1g10330 [Cornus florida]|uniref:putative pentatricopeptide repeat-containing protein At1g10330 n=1 Tax=Cornus florida TaxID=4283 RepID=UPI00289EFA1A|nr:putative pentatricopeptide repeat-containing protein At1g10330 [Cornus florida]
MPYSPEFLLQLLQKFLFRHPNQVKQIHSLIITNGHFLHTPKTPPNLKWMSTLLYNTIIRAYLNLGKPHNTILLFTQMLAHRAPPNNHTFPSLIKASSSSPSLASITGIPLHTQALKRGVSSDPFVQTSFLNLYAQLGSISDAHKVFEEISEPCIVSYNAMLDAFGKNGDMGSALYLFKNMPVRDVVSWTSIINGYGRNGYFREAIQFFEKMMAHEDPNEATFVSVLSSCANSDGGEALYQGKQIHGFIIKNEIELTIFMGTALIALYGKTGCLGYAMKVFRKMEVKAVCTWNAMICSLALNGMEKQALDMFEKMKVVGLHPNEVTFVAVLTACARAKLVELGLELFRMMSSDFGVVPKMEHYGCVVDLLGRAGLLREATEFMRRMPFEPDASVLGALLGACKVHGAIELANEVGRRLLELQPQHCGRYVLLSSIYAGSERWERAAALRKTMVESGIRKIPAYSMISSV